MRRWRRTTWRGCTPAAASSSTGRCNWPRRPRRRCRTTRSSTTRSAFVYLKKQLPSLAIPPLRLAVEKDPANPAFHYRLGLAYSQTGDKVSARQALEQALKLKADFEGAEDARKVLRTLG